MVTKPLIFESTLKSKKNALLQLEKFFYQGLEHNGVQLPAAINFTHYTHGTGQVRSNTFPLLALRSKRLKIALGNMLSINPERAVSSSLFCKSMVTKPLIDCRRTL
jgi:hypothetical protein